MSLLNGDKAREKSKAPSEDQNARQRARHQASPCGKAPGTATAWRILILLPRVIAF